MKVKCFYGADGLLREVVWTLDTIGAEAQHQWC